jgi:hypothetical protein
MDQTMSLSRSITNLGLLITMGTLPSVSVAPVAAQIERIQGSPMQVTSDTPEYCLYLLDRVSDLVRLTVQPIPRQVTDLTTEGQRMCAHGQTRGGIMRLRSALMMMEKDNGPAYR